MKMNDLLFELNVKKTAALLSPDIKFNKAAAALDPAAASAAKKATTTIRKTARQKALEKEREANIRDIKRDFFPTMDKLTVKQKNELRLRIQQELDSSASKLSAAERKSLKDAFTDNKLTNWIKDNPGKASTILGTGLATATGITAYMASGDGAKSDAVPAAAPALPASASAPADKKVITPERPDPITDADVAPKKSTMSGRRPDLQADSSPAAAPASKAVAQVDAPEKKVVAKPVASKASFSKDVTDLAKANNIANPNLIKVGQEIILPGNRRYNVTAGDTLSRIAGGKFKGAEPLSPAQPVSAGDGGASSGNVKDGIKTGPELLDRPLKGSTDSDEDKAFRAKWREEAMARMLQQMDSIDSRPSPRSAEALASDELWKEIRASAAGKSEQEIRDAAAKARQELEALTSTEINSSPVPRGPDLTTQTQDIEMKGADLSKYVAPVTVGDDEETRLERQRRLDQLESKEILKLAGLKPITERDFTQGIIKVKPLQTLTESTELNECGAMGVTTPTNASLSISASASTGDEVASMLQSIMTLAGLKPVTQDMMPMASDPMPMVKAMDIVANPDMLGGAEEPTSFEIDSDGNGESDIEVDVVDADSLNANPEADETPAEDEGEEKKAEEGFEDATTRPNPQSLPGKGYGDLEDNTNKRRNFRYTPPGSGSNPLMKPRTMGESIDSVTADLFKAYESFKNGQ